MKKVLAFTLLCFVMLTTAFAQNAAKQADIKFDKTSHNFGTFSEDNPVVTCVFTFKNTGTAPDYPSGRAILRMYCANLYQRAGETRRER